MIRFLVSAVEEAVGGEIAARLRGATIAACLDASRVLQSPQAWDAVAFIGASRLDPTLIQRFLNEGKHLLLAADSCLPLPVLDDLAGVARQKGVQFAVVNPDHYLPSRHLIRQQLDAGRLGGAGLVRIHRWKPPDDQAWEDSRQSPDFPRPLLRDIELACWLVGKPPNLVYTVGVGGGFVQVHLGYAGGAMALIDYAVGLPPGAGYQSLSVIGSAGAAYADDHQNMQLLFRGGQPQAVRTEEGIKQLALMIQEFVDAVQAGRDLSGSMAAWRSAWTIAKAVVSSLEGHRVVPVEAN